MTSLAEDGPVVAGAPDRPHRGPEAAQRRNALGKAVGLRAHGGSESEYYAGMPPRASGGHSGVSSAQTGMWSLTLNALGAEPTLAQPAGRSPRVRR